MTPFDDPIFVINLDGSDQRLTSAQDQLAQANLNFERIDAVDGRGRPATDFPTYQSTQAIRFFGRDLTSGEVGCYLSHVKAAQAVLDSGADYGLVFEDDFRATAQSWTVLSELSEILKSDACAGWEMVNLGRAPRVVTRAIASISLPNDASCTVFHAYYFPVIATAILWSKDGAARFVKEASSPIAPIDHMFRFFMSERGQGLALEPAPFSFLNVASDIAQASQNDRPKPKQNWWAKKRSEVYRQTTCFRRAIYHKWIK